MDLSPLASTRLGTICFKISFSIIFLCVFIIFVFLLESSSFFFFYISLYFRPSNFSFFKFLFFNKMSLHLLLSFSLIFFFIFLFQFPLVFIMSFRFFILFSYGLYYFSHNFVVKTCWRTIRHIALKCKFRYPFVIFGTILLD